MSVRSGILAVLSLGPAYGLQLHTEIEARTARTGRINVGQIYSTLNRLVDAGLVTPTEPAAFDRLPRYELTAAGASEVDGWVAGAGLGAADWAGMVEHVLLVVSLPGVDPGILIDSYRAAWNGVLVESGTAVDHPFSPTIRAARAADSLLATAALSWLDDLEAAVLRGEIGARPLSDERPRRGRRPGVVS